MSGFSEEHERLVAIEWLVQRLAVEHCLSVRDPIAAAHQIVADAEAYGQEVIEVAAQGEGQLHTAVGISASLSVLVEGLPADVADAIG
ncbi:hypothetical protein [Bauldia litoralis]|uniref:hypothetical protein n=1 Tax=Bauldia litoralis TaxID=665467 RepID=UPI0032636362